MNQDSGKQATIKGLLIEGILQYIQNHHGDDAIHQLMQQFSSDEKKLLQEVEKDTRIPASIINKLFMVITALWGDGKTDYFSHIVGEIAEHNINVFLKFLILFNSPSIMAHAVPRVYRFYLDTGKITMVAIKKHYVEFNVKQGKVYGEGLCSAIIGWGRKGLNMCGAKNIRVNHNECIHKGRSACVYKVAWD